MRFLRYCCVVPLVVSVLFFTGCHKRLSATNWVCTATDSSARHWIDFAPTRVEASASVMNRCRSTGGYRATCVVRCIPPARRWHCVSVDKAGHTWYWNSRKEKVAVRNARWECVKNTTVGGCHVPPVNCSLLTSYTAHRRK